MDQQSKTRQMVLAGLLAAVVFAGNFFRIILPIDIGGTTSFTLGNIFCVLAGLLLGPAGGLAAGVGSALYDLTNPLYIMEVPFTFLNKAVMGLVAGMVARRGAKEPGYLRCTVAALCGALAYYALYFIKSYFYNGLLVQGLPSEAALLALIPRIPTSLFNGGVAVVLAPPLACAILAALRKAGTASLALRHSPKQRKGALIPLGVVLAIAIGAVSVITYVFPKTPELAAERKIASYRRTEYLTDSPTGRVAADGVELLYYVSDKGLLTAVCKPKLLGYDCIDLNTTEVDWAAIDKRAILRGSRAGDLWVNSGIVLDQAVTRITVSGQEATLVTVADETGKEHTFYYQIAPFSNTTPIFKLYDAAGNELENLG